MDKAQFSELARNYQKTSMLAQAYEQQRKELLVSFREGLHQLRDRLFVVSYKTGLIGSWDSQRNNLAYAMRSVVPIRRESVTAGIRKIGTQDIILSLAHENGVLTSLAEQVPFDSFVVLEVKE
jgi:hypothetical protein